MSQNGIKSFLIVSIHSWSSYQEKLVIQGATSGEDEFQSTPGLVTRRNLLFKKGLAKSDEVSIHSWSSYQEKLLPSRQDFPTYLFQSTPGLVTRRNRPQVRYLRGTDLFQSTPGLVTRRNFCKLGVYGPVGFNPLLV